MTDAGTKTPAEAEGPVHDIYLVRRIEASENLIAQLRRRVTFVLVFVAILLGVTSTVIYLAGRHGMPGMVPQVVESREFLLRDRTGQVRGAWGVDARGDIQLVLQGGDNKASVRLSLLEDGAAGLTLSDPEGKPRLVAGLLPHENVSLVLADSLGVTRAVFGLNADGSTSLVFADRNGVTRTAIGAAASGQPIFATGEAEAGVVDTVQ
jgi:hypothetical protein